jgi:TP901 family phage tail tape measure protein
MGFNAKNVQAFTDSIIKGAKALDFDAVVAVEQVGKILSMTNQMGTAVESSLDIMNKVANLENNLAGVKADGVIDVWQRSADIFAQLNFDNDQMGAMSAFLEQTSVSSELGASGFKSMISKFKELDGELGFFTKIKTGGIQGVKDVMAEIAKMSPSQLKGFGTEALTQAPYYPPPIS